MSSKNLSKCNKIPLPEHLKKFIGQKRPKETTSTMRISKKDKRFLESLSKAYNKDLTKVVEDIIKAYDASGSVAFLSIPSGLYENIKELSKQFEMASVDVINRSINHILQNGVDLRKVDLLGLRKKKIKAAPEQDRIKKKSDSKTPTENIIIKTSKEIKNALGRITDKLGLKSRAETFRLILHDLRSQ